MTNSYILQSVETYKTELSSSLHDIINIYIAIVGEFLKCMYKYINNIKNKKHAHFIFFRGLDTITHVFQHILLYTRNLNAVQYHTEKSIYFYIEFISQVSESQNMFLQLSSRDAAIYVYKKTIYTLKSSDENYVTMRLKEKQLFANITSKIRDIKNKIDELFTGEDNTTHMLKALEVFKV